MFINNYYFHVFILIYKSLTSNSKIKMSILKQEGSTCLSFGEALELLKSGKMVQRSGWNGKGMFIFERPADELEVGFIIDKVKSLPQSVKDFFKSKDEKEAPSEQGLSKVKFGSYLCMYAADGSIVNGWLASQTDMLSNDWCEVIIS